MGNNHFENCEGSSAQLGLAIAILLNASDSPIRYAIATGSLSTDKHADDDVAIGLVGSVPEKLNLIIEKRKANALKNMPLYCFTPTQYQEDGELYLVAELEQVKQLAALNIEVKPITWLREATEILKADNIRRLKQDQLIDIIAGANICLLLSFVLYQAWWHWEIPVNLLPYSGKSKAEPFLVCANRDHSTVSYADLERDGSAPLLPLFAKENPDYNVGLGWKLLAGETPFSKQYFCRLYSFG